MSKVLVDRELLELLRNFTFLHDDGCAGVLRGNIDKALSAQPAEATSEGANRMNQQLKPCPFCGKPLTVTARRHNPHARCRTENCKGAQLPLLNLDQPEDIERWNRRSEGEAEAECDQLRAEVERLKSELFCRPFVC